MRGRRWRQRRIRCPHRLAGVRSGATRAIGVPGSHSLEWSRDGSRLAVFPGAVYLADGRKAAELTPGIYGGIWSPDGLTILSSLGFVDAQTGALDVFALPGEVNGARVEPIGWTDGEGGALVLAFWVGKGERRT